MLPAQRIGLACVRWAQWQIYNLRRWLHRHRQHTVCMERVSQCKQMLRAWAWWQSRRRVIWHSCGVRGSVVRVDADLPILEIDLIGLDCAAVKSPFQNTAACSFIGCRTGRHPASLPIISQPERATGHLQCLRSGCRSSLPSCVDGYDWKRCPGEV